MGNTKVLAVGSGLLKGGEEAAQSGLRGSQSQASRTLAPEKKGLDAFKCSHAQPREIEA